MYHFISVCERSLLTGAKEFAPMFALIYLDHECHACMSNLSRNVRGITKELYAELQMKLQYANLKVEFYRDPDGIVNNRIAGMKQFEDQVIAAETVEELCGLDKRSLRERGIVLHSKPLDSVQIYACDEEFCFLLTSPSERVKAVTNFIEWDYLDGFYQEGWNYDDEHDGDLVDFGRLYPKTFRPNTPSDVA